ncbi:MAG: Na+:solute symporter [Armatimonadota bacterium]|nr:Na+:solute symporter [Armatimonadota bacterium]
MLKRLNPIDIGIIIAYLAIVIALGIWMKKKASKNIGSYFLGERQLPWWALAMSGSSSYFDITGTMWIVSLFVTIGLKGMWVQWIWGFIIPVFYMAYMGKWIRRSGVMTGSEWMETRFGSGKAGEAARASYTLYAVLTITAFLAYGATGMGKFGSVYLPFSEHTCAALIIGITGIYVIVGGFHGVVMVEIFQTIVLSIGAIVIAYLGFAHVSPQALSAKVPSEWGSLLPNRWDFAYITDPAYKLFGALLIIWVMKGLLLSLSGPEQLYDFQRFLAAKNPKEASKLGALWGIIHTVRWPMAMGLAILGIVGLAEIGDPEKVLPSVIQNMLPVGLRGFAIAALLSGFLATFNSTVNGGASYIVKDIYHKYINPNASQRKLIYASYVSSALLIALGIAIGFAAKSINQMFTWIMGTLGAGVLMPNVLRWYWWRMNGWGYAAGAVSGMVLSLIQAFVPKFAAMPLYLTFPAIVFLVLGITIAVTLLTKPTDEKTLRKFYTEVRPAGWWGAVAKDLALDGRLRRPFSQDFANVLIGIPWLIAMWMCPIYLVLHRFTEALIAGGIVVMTSLILWQTWYRRLEED